MSEGKKKEMPSFFIDGKEHKIYVINSTKINILINYQLLNGAVT